MPSPPTLASLVQDTLAHLPMLARELQDATQDELATRPQHHMLQEAWSRQRLRFAERFEQALTPMLEAAARGEDPLQRRNARDLDSLSLVDEQQALQDVAVAHLIQMVDDHSRAELHQLGNFFAALRGTARARKDDNPLRPALFAQGLNQALQWLSLDTDGRYALMRVMDQPLAQALGKLYVGLCAQLRDAQLTPLIARRGAQQQSDEQRLRRASNAYIDLGPTSIQPATLDGLARRVEAFNAQPQRLGPAVTGGAGRDLLSRLYDQILADPHLLPPVKALLARLQIAVARLASSDVSLLRRQDHPTWLLLNRVAAHGSAFERSDDPELQEFLRFMGEHIQPLLEQPQPRAVQFERLLHEVDAHISSRAAQRSEPSSSALATLEREQLREPWLRLLREQIRAQIVDAPDAQTSPLLRRFLQDSWTQVILQAMLRHGRDAPQAQAHIELVDRLLDSLRPSADDAQRRRHRAGLPALIQALEQGCDAIAMPKPERQALFDDLMQLHGRLLLGPPVAAPEVAPAPPPPDPETLLRQLLSERESQMPSRWAHEEVDRSRLATVPVQLYNGDHTVESQLALREWMERLAIGNWYHMFVQSQWLTAQLAWISESRQFFLFVGQDADERHSLTRGALEHLLGHGLMTVLEEDSLVQRAVDTLMQDLSDPV